MSKKFTCEFCGELISEPYKVKEEVMSKTGNKRNVYHKYCNSEHYTSHIEYKINKPLIVEQCKELVGGYDVQSFKLFNKYLVEFKYDTEALLMLLDENFLEIQIRLDDLVSSTLIDKINYMFTIFRNNIHEYKRILREEQRFCPDMEITENIRYNRRKRRKKTFVDILEGK